MVRYPNVGYKITENALAVITERYLFRNEKGQVVEDVPQMFQRVAQCIAGVERTPAKRKLYEQEFYDMLASGDFMPNSPTLLNAGRANHSVMSGCFVFDVEDSIYEGGQGSIFGAIKLMALIHKMGGGTGCSFHKLRQEGARVSSTGHIASGPVSFMRNFDEAIEAIQQGGMRRGAHMSLMNVHHPDIREFINCKNSLNQRTEVVMRRITKALHLDEGGEFYKAIKTAIVRSQLTNMNISIVLTKEFKDALERGENYDLIDPKTKKIVGRENAKSIFRLMAENAWKSGEPGFIDFDEINRYNPCPKLGDLYLVNPCGEQPLRAYESCNLGSIALPRMIKDGNALAIAKFDFEKFRSRVRLAVRFLDNVIDAQEYPVKEIERETKRTRKIGLGVMGFADALIKLGIPYGSEECMEFISAFMHVLKEESYNYSVELAKEKGNFPAWNKSIYYRKTKMRNALRTTQAPTGSISGIACVSFGIEPIYGLSFRRTILDQKTFMEVNLLAQAFLKEKGCWNKSIESYILENGTIQGYETIPQEVRDVLKIAHEIEPLKHIQVQAEFQKYFDNAVSKTINMPRESTAKEVEEIFYKALELKCKGITIYRDGSRGEQVLEVGKLRRASIREVRSRPIKLNGTTYEKDIGDCGRLYITINSDEDGYPFEIFISAGKTGGCMQSQVEAIGRLISTCWRSGLGIDRIVKQLIGITCHQSKPSIDKSRSFLSCADAIARTIQEHFSEDNKVEATIREENRMVPTCNKCGGPLIPESHCMTCAACLNSLCG